MEIMPPSVKTSPPSSSPHNRSGLLAAVGAYSLWGIMPLYFLLLLPSGPAEIVSWRVLFSLAFCLILITVTRKWGAFLAIARQPRLVLLMGLAGVLIYINWQIFIFAATTGHVLETSLGYFILPVLTVLLGVVFLREKVRPIQWGALAFGAAAIVVLSIEYGSLPWISLSLAATFGIYGLIKKMAGPRIDALTGLTLETLWLVPVAVIVLFVVGTGPGLTLTTEGTGHLIALLAAGVVTMIPLLMFAAAARRLTLVSLGIVQYLAPIISFLFGAFVLHEAMPPGRWLGFGLIWIALVILVIDMIIQGRMSRRAFAELV